MKLPKITLIADFRTALRWWSIQLGIVASAIIGYVVNNPMVLFQYAGSLPQNQRLIFAILVSVFCFVVIYIARVAQQSVPDGKLGVQPEGTASGNSTNPPAA